MKKRYSRETRRVVLHTLMFFPFFTAEDPFHPFGIFVSAYFFFRVSISQSIDTLCADASMCYRSVQASTIYSYLFCSSPVFHTQREYEKILEKNVQYESATSIMTMCSTAAAIVGATSDLAQISVEGIAIWDLAQNQNDDLRFKSETLIAPIGRMERTKRRVKHKWCVLCD